MMTSTLKVLALVPAYREEGRVGKVVRGVKKYVADVLVVDDGSPDGTAAEAAAAGAGIIRFDVNRGKGIALREGFRAAARAGFDAVVTLDADGQHDPARIPAVVAALTRGADVVLGSRLKSLKGMPPQRVFSNTFTTAVISLLAGRLIRDSQTGYRGLKLALVARLPLVRKGFDMETELILQAARAGARFSHVDIPTIYGDEKSKINVPADAYRFFRVVIHELLGRLEV